MGSNIKIINVRYRNYTLDSEDLLESSNLNDFRYKFTTVVVYNKKTKGRKDLTEPPLTESYNNESPFSLYKSGTPIAVLKSYIGDNFHKSKLSLATKAFKELKNFASQCCERITADLCCQVVMKEIKEERRKGNSQTLVFFIEKSASDKMLGRLSALQLNLDNIIICFLTYDPPNLMTIAMSNQTSKLHFDINRLMLSHDSDFFGPYPGDSEDSLIQTYFHRPPTAEKVGGEYSPMRFDIFSQGLRRDEIDNKKELVKKIFSDSKNTDSKEQKKTVPRKLVPMGWRELKRYLDRQNDDIREKLRKREE
jgi:hypothetical protein